MIKRWVRRLAEYVFGSYLAELRQINLNLTIALTYLESNSKPQQERTKPDLSGFMNLQPLQPLSKGGSIYPAEE